MKAHCLLNVRYYLGNIPAADSRIHNLLLVQEINAMPWLNRLLSLQNRRWNAVEGKKNPHHYP